MVKKEIIPCSKEEINNLIEASIENEFIYMFFMTAKLTGRRLGELWGNQKKVEIGKKKIGVKIEYQDGKEIPLDKVRKMYKRIPKEFEGGVKVKDINFNEGLMKIWILKRRKLVQDETILPKELIQVLKHYVAKNKLKQEDYLFRKLSYRGIQQAVKKYSKKAGINHNVSFHNFRHYFVTELKRKGWANDEIRKLTGHKSSQVLSIYDHVVARDIKDKALEDLKDI